MRKKLEWQWEKLDENTWRAKTLGGWIVKCIEGKAVSCLFIVDRDLEWHIMPPPKEEPNPKKHELFSPKS